MDILNLLQQMLILLIFMVVGFVAGKTKIIDPEGNKKLSKMLLNLTQPAMILSAAINSDLSFTPMDVLKLLLYACSMYAVLFALAYLITPLFRVDSRRKKTYRFMTIFANVAFMGFPVVSALYGPDAVLIASLYCVPFNLIVYSLGPLMLSDGGDVKLNWRVFVSPALICTVIGVFIIFLRPELPYVIGQAAESLGSMTVPGSMIVIGVSLAGAPLKSVFSDGYTYLLCLARLIISPIVVWAVCSLFIQDTTYLGILVVLASMPVAAISTMLCIEYDGAEETASRGVFMTTILAVGTSPLMIYLLLM